MNKGLIDLKRASTPPANPLVGEEVSAPEPVAPPSLVPAAEAANTNQASPPSLAVVQDTPSVAQVADRVSTIGARIPETLHHNIKVFCIASRMEMQKFVQDALALHLERLQDAAKEK